MHFLRFTHNVWGQEVMEGISWDLLPVAIGIGLAVIVGHALYRVVRKK
ncbi:MAG TPA: hypothetical protein VLW26_03345 [Steroidobacteraceae bacterium]|nr:hypothetical protein [Steroidobacteraceae bacterium]